MKASDIISVVLAFIGVLIFGCGLLFAPVDKKSRPFALMAYIGTLILVVLATLTIGR
jgi:hypothetical protein